MKPERSCTQNMICKGSLSFHSVASSCSAARKAVYEQRRGVLFTKSTVSCHDEK